VQSTRRRESSQIEGELTGKEPAARRRRGGHSKEPDPTLSNRTMSHTYHILTSESEEALSETSILSQGEIPDCTDDEIPYLGGFSLLTTEDLSAEESELTYLNQTFFYQNQREECRRLLCLGKAHRKEAAASYFQPAKAIAQEIGDLQTLAKAEIGLGNAHDDNQIEHYRAALDIARKIGDRSLEAQALIGLGNAYSAKRHNATAHQHFSDAVKIVPTEALREKANNGRKRAEHFLSKSPGFEDSLKN
jgi:tetratricopeptide (TPR) repeat protein